MNKIRIPIPVYRVMQRHAEESYPNECCGILIGRKETSNDAITLLRVVPAENQEKDRGRDRFILDPLFYLKTEENLKDEERIVGFYHSHPDCPEIPSETDRMYAQGWPGFIWTIHRVEQGTHVSSRSWILEENGERFREIIMEFLP
jgi:proteasome lid subunit RPN8/RPN11